MHFFRLLHFKDWNPYDKICLYVVSLNFTRSFFRAYGVSLALTKFDETGCKRIVYTKRSRSGE